MKSHIALIFLSCLILFTACTKGVRTSSINANDTNTTAGQFVLYTIRKGQQFCDQNNYKSINTADMKFQVMFDSSAIYQTQKTANQEDINKLYGFSDNNSDHHQYSARIGWKWSDGSLHLLAYVYNKGMVSYKNLAVVSIGPVINCSILVDSSNYLFGINGILTRMPRMSTTVTAMGYQLYPYFGGEESAPHDITIRIRDVQ